MNLARKLVFGLAVLVFGSTQVWADPTIMTLSVPDFFIPIGNRHGNVNVFTGGSYEQNCGGVTTGCINVLLPNQTTTVARNSSSTGWMTLNLYFSGLPLSDPSYVVGDAHIQFRVFDLDFQIDEVATRIRLQEMAILSAADGTLLADLSHYLPTTTTPTDDRWVDLSPIDLVPPLDDADFTNPFVLTLRFTATVVNNRNNAVTLVNTRETIVSNLTLSLTELPPPPPPVDPPPVLPPPDPPHHIPEPTSLMLIGVGLAGIGLYRRAHL